MKKLLAPKNLENILKCKNLLSPSEYEQLLVFVHFLVLKGFYYEHVINRQPIEISHSFLCKKIFNRKTCSKILDIAEVMDAIFIDHSYVVGEKSKRYRLNFLGKLEIETYDYDFLYERNKSKFDSLFQSTAVAYSNPSQDLNNRIQQEFLDKLELDKGMFESVLKQLITSKRESGKSGIFYLNHLAIVQSECYAFDRLKGYSFYDNFGTAGDL